MHVTTQGKCSECGAQFDGCHALFSKVETLTLQRDEACRVGEEFRRKLDESEERNIVAKILCKEKDQKITELSERVSQLENALQSAADELKPLDLCRDCNDRNKELVEKVAAAFWSATGESRQDNNDPERPLKPGEDPFAPHRHIFTEKAKAQCDCESPQGDHYTDCGSQTEVCEHCGKEMENDSGLTIHERTCKSFEPVRCPHGVILDDPDLRLSCRGCEEPKPNYFEILKQVPSGEQGESPRLSGLIEGKGRLNPPPVSSEQVSESKGVSQIMNRDLCGCGLERGHKGVCQIPPDCEGCRIGGTHTCQPRPVHSEPDSQRRAKAVVKQMDDDYEKFYGKVTANEDGTTNYEPFRSEAYDQYRADLIAAAIVDAVTAHSTPECPECHGSRRVQVDTWEEDCQRCLSSTPEGSAK